VTYINYEWIQQRRKDHEYIYIAEHGDGAL